MNGMEAFFKKYHAVPATNAGTNWQNASLDALEGWLSEDTKLWDERPTTREQIRGRLTDIASELKRRAKEVTGNSVADILRRERLLFGMERILRRIGADALES